MKLEKEFQPIRDWAQERGIYDKGDVKTQFVKLQEELGELAQAILKRNPEEFCDAIGDCCVVLTNLAELGKKYFRENCTHCHGTGYFMEDVANDGGSRMQVDCDYCYSVGIEECLNSAYRVIKDRKGSMKGGTFVKQQ